MPKWTYPLAFFFLLFLIYTDPSGAGQLAGQFAAFAVQLLSGIGEFITGLFQGASGDPASIDTSTGNTLLSDPGLTTSTILNPGTLPSGTESGAGVVAGQSASVSGAITHSHNQLHTHVPTTLG